MTTVGRPAYRIADKDHIPALTVEELQLRRCAIEDSRKAHEAYLAAGGKAMTQEEFEELWNKVDL